jgi:hypothetical protein
MTSASRRQQPPAEPHYDIDKLDVDGVLVHLRANGLWIQGQRQKKTTQRQFVVSGQVLPPKLKPDLWAPIDPLTFPGVLPTGSASGLEWSEPYLKPGLISNEEIEVRVVRGLRSAGLVKVTGWQSSLKDKADELQSCRWFAALGHARREQWNQDQKLFSWRAGDPKIPFREIGRLLDLSATGANLRYERVVGKLAAIANGASVAKSA